MRIVAGRLKGRPLLAPEGRDVRPTSDRAREAVFNVLMHRFQGQGFQLIGARVLDAFAGAGGLGLEALSRGAGHVTFFDTSSTARRVIEGNLGALKIPRSEVTVLQADATRPPRAVAPCELVFLDPPYDGGLMEPALRALAAAGWLAADALCICEERAGTTTPTPEGFELLDERRYGKAQVRFLRYAAEDSD